MSKLQKIECLLQKGKKGREGRKPAWLSAIAVRQGLERLEACLAICDSSQTGVGMVRKVRKVGKVGKVRMVGMVGMAGVRKLIIL